MLEQRRPESAVRDVLPYRKPKLGRDYWIKDNALPNALEVYERNLAREDWTRGAPWRPEIWPGIRAPHALTPAELAPIEQWIREQAGVRALKQEAPSQGALSHNHVQLVGEKESTAKPHVDSLALCDFAGVIYLHPKPPVRHVGTSFYRLRMPGGGLGGNTCPPGCVNLTQAFGVTKLPANAWTQDMEVENVFNRLIVYRADFVHSATAYFGQGDKRNKRATALFFWKAVR
ncbi:hypothetical protein HRD49_39620 [Corallococcus exiguus]|uniref:DUF6445 family protein n=1 Tax=Corallococcus exiguus TaxID=83462 RepID=UPI0015608FB6|nr:DUF6445 family protein [Corallococcus exiguus]NRD67856.1 hypothetical protein [Corallococcus exiguus]